jgi:hypothetical protein
MSLTEEEVEKYCASGTEEVGIKIGTPICPECLTTKTAVSKILTKEEKDRVINQFVEHRERQVLRKAVEKKKKA